MTQDISGAQNSPVVVMAGNIIVTEGSKFAECFNSEFCSKLAREVQIPTLSKLTFHISALSASTPFIATGALKDIYHLTP